jgi:GNAT superfamily N-acetyltransferase
MPKKIASPETIQARFDCPWDEVVRLADRHTRAVQSWLSTRAPQAERFEGLGVTAGSSGLKVDLLNLALGCDFPAQVDDETITAEIEAVKTFFARREAPWRWWIGPHPHPLDIDRRLARQQVILRSRLPTMVAPLRPGVSLSDTFPPLNPEVQVWLASDQADLQAASTIRRIAFRFPEGQAHDYFEAMAGDWLRAEPARLFLARLGAGPPAAIGALIMGAGLPGVYIMATLPEWGRRGLGKAIMARIVSEAAAAEHPMLTLTAGEQGYGLYCQFGFEHLFDYSIFSV